MKSKKVITETTQVDEAQPMGVFSRMGNKLATKVSGIAPNFAAQAAGKLQTGQLANQAMAQYKQFLGQIGEKPSKENVIEFLTSKGYPTAKAQAALDALPEPTAPLAAPNGTPSAAPTAGGTATGLAGAVSEGQVHTVDLMRSYLSILREDTSISDADAAKIIMAASQEHARTLATPKAAPAAAQAAQAAQASPAAPSRTASTQAVQKIISSFTLLSPAEKKDALEKLQSATGEYQAESQRK